MIYILLWGVLVVCLLGAILEGVCDYTGAFGITIVLYMLIVIVFVCNMHTVTYDVLLGTETYEIVENSANKYYTDNIDGISVIDTEGKVRHLTNVARNPEMYIKKADKAYIEYKVYERNSYLAIFKWTEKLDKKYTNIKMEVINNITIYEKAE